jgi:hypothetical protein
MLAGETLTMVQQAQNLGDKEPFAGGHMENVKKAKRKPLRPKGRLTSTPIT